MDGDEEKSGATAVCDGDPGDEAEASGDAAPVPEEAEAAQCASAEDEPDDAPVASDEPPPTEQAGEPVVAVAPDDSGSDGSQPDPVAVEDVAPDGGVPAVARVRRLRPYLRRGAVALVAAGFVALGVSAFAWVVPSPEAADRRFVETAQSHGHDIAPGEQETLVVSAARKICERKDISDTLQERRATALSSTEIAAVGAAFGAETRDFTALALETYCSL